MTDRSIQLIEVAARDGLQNEKASLSAQERIAFIDKLHAAGLYHIEAGSFVHPKAVPQMQNSDTVAEHYKKHPTTADLSYLVPNMRGLQTAFDHDVKHIAVFLAATETFSQANIRKSIDEAFTAIVEVVQSALDAGLQVRGYLSTVFKSVQGEPVDPKKVAQLSKRLLDMGCYEVSLGDTTGVGTPVATKQLIEAHHLEGISNAKLAMHYHDTYGRAIENIDQAYELGIRRFDASTSGIGGCPFAQSATGNVDTLKVLKWASAKGLKFGPIDVELLKECAQWIQALLSQKSAEIG